MIKHIPPEDRSEYEALLAEVVTKHQGTGARSAALVAGIDDAIQAHRQWAMVVDQSNRLDGAAKEIKRYLDRNRVVINVGDEDAPREVSKSRVMGAKRQASNGKWIDVQLPFELLTWDDVAIKQAECQQMQRSYGDTLVLLERMASLQQQAPETTGPADAADSLGIELDDWLADSA